MIPAAQPLPQTATDIPQQTYVPTKDPNTGLDTSGAACARCHKELYEKDIIKQPRCGHLFHSHCLDNYLRTEICCPVCKNQVLFPAARAALVHEGKAPQAVYPSTQLPPRAVPVATAFAPLDGTDSRNYAACRACGQMFYRDPTKVRPETNGWYRCQRYVMDADGVWNVARVLSVRSSDEVKVTYDGWDEVYNEVVCMDSDRVAPYHTFTWAVKCWVKYLNWPLWPAVITIRTPGTEEGIVNLAKENRLWVDFFDHPNFMKRDRCWQKKSQVKIFDDHYDENGFGACGKEFDQSLELMLKSDATTEMPKFAKGTVPVEYKDITTESVDQKRNSMGDNFWFKNFADNRERHYQIHIYDMIGDIKMKRIADAQETFRKLEQAKLEAVDTEKEKKRASSNTGITRQHGAQLTSAEVNASRPQRENAERSLLERIAGKEYVYSDIDETRKGRVKETSVDQELSRAESNHSLLSVSKEPSSDSDESKGIPSPLEEETPTDLPSNEEEAKIPEQAAEKIRSTSCSPCKALELEEPLQSVTQRENSNGDDKEEKESQEPRRRFCVMQVGKEDVMDIDGVWNVARVLSVPSSEEVEVTYDGWPKKYNEVVHVDCDRVAPYHTFTWAVKCWVKYLNWPMWPSVITIRTPGTEEGVENLAMENQFYVDFLDDPIFGKRDRCWQKKHQVRTFDDNYDKNRMGTNGAQFERALGSKTYNVSRKQKIDGLTHLKRARHSKAKEAGCLHQETWMNMFNDKTKVESEESDDDGFSDGFDPGTTSEDKAASPPDSRTDSGDILATADTTVRSTVHVGPTPGDMIPEDPDGTQSISTDATKEASGHEQGGSAQSLRKRMAGKTSSRLDETREGRVKDTPVVLDLGSSEQLNHSFLSARTAYSIDSEESKGVLSQFEEFMVIDPLSDEEESKTEETADAKSTFFRGVPSELLDVEIPTESKQSEPPTETVDAGGDEGSQETRRRACVMRADKEGIFCFG
ncbi:hypothetical protein BBJ29_006020 [Phytophthora kernoviae]|uniref:RING-type domain-containing protein n=1 Tax=Phytophthora kernoviae TaxID=325452 RepID=A0A3R7JNZ1_9STRA|nr:hypothetical protein BBJ29_006020 [Phytophthora kernoviae]